MSIDKKIDDGLPRSGKVLSSGNDYWHGAGTGNWFMPYSDPPVDQGPAGANSRYCLTNANPSQYNVQNMTGMDESYADYPRTSICTLTVKSSF